MPSRGDKVHVLTSRYAVVFQTSSLAVLLDFVKIVKNRRPMFELYRENNWSKRINFTIDHKTAIKRLFMQLSNLEFQ